MEESIVFCSACMMSSLPKFTFAISSPDEFLVFNCRDADTWIDIQRLFCAHVWCTDNNVNNVNNKT